MCVCQGKFSSFLSYLRKVSSLNCLVCSLATWRPDSCRQHGSLSSCCDSLQIIMASIGIRLLYLTIICIGAGNASSFVNMECKAESVGQYNHQSMLECVIQTTKDVVDAQVFTVTWRKVGAEKPVLFFYKGNTEQQPRFRFAEPSWNNKNMNVSLLITNTMVTDIGSYECIVMTDSGDTSKSTTLRVTAKYSKPTIRTMPAKNIPNVAAILSCQSNGGYPEGQLRWFDVHNHEWTKSSKMDVKQMEDGLFSLSSELTLFEGSISSTYTCSIHSGSAKRNKEDEATYDVPSAVIGVPEKSGSSESSKVVAPVVVIGSLIVGLLIVLVLLYRRRYRRHNQEVPTEELYLEANQEVKNFCQDVHT